MTFRDDDRAVTVQVGVVLLFAILVVAMSLYQSTVVPNQNQAAEFDHERRVQGQLIDLRNAVLGTGATGAGQPVSVTLGTQYPQRTFFINPPPATGELRTASAGSFTVENVTALSAETSDYLNSSRRTLSFATRHLVYEPNYREYDDAPATVYENTVGYRRYESTDVPVTDQSLVQGRQVTLVALDGSIAQSQAGTVSVDPRAVSPSATAARTVSVRRNATGRPVTVRVPTDLSEQRWEKLLADQRVSEGGYVANVGVDGGVLTLTLDGERGGSAVTYDLRMANVDVGSSAADAGPAYVTDVRGTTRSVAPGTSTTLVAEVRDEFNNPVSGVRVNVSGAASRVDRASRTTGEDGRVTFAYRAPGHAASETVTLEIRDGNAAAERVAYSVETTGSGNASGGTYDVEWVDASGAGLTCDAGLEQCTLNADQGTTVDLTATVTENGDGLTGATLDYALDSSTFGTLSPGEDVTHGGNATTTLDVPAENGTVTVYAESGGDADPIEIAVEDPGSTGPPADPGFAYEDVDHDGEYVASVDTKIPDSELADGVYDATGNGSSLVVPASVGDISAPRIDFAGQNVSVGVNLTATQYDGEVTIDATDDVDVTGVALEAQGWNENVTVSSGGTVTAADAEITSHGPVDVSAVGDVNVRRARVDTTSEHGMQVNVTSLDGGVDASQTSLAARSSVTVDARGGDLTAVGASVDTNVGDAYAVRVTMTASNAVDVTDATVDSSGTVAVTADGGNLVATNATVDTSSEYGMDVALTANDDVYVDDSTLRSDSGDLTADVTGTPPNSRTVYVGGATFVDANDRLDVSPNSVQVSGPNGKTE
ncbi:hypothetical protein [Halomicrococcus gelatinilyticus]|uniref:hypothetical protein n=1 Tax=Halomicrococcus gelatinilyticus TaxID=1702103 RepID=UPI002E0DF645